MNNLKWFLQRIGADEDDDAAMYSVSKGTKYFVRDRCFPFRPA